MRRPRDLDLARCVPVRLHLCRHAKEERVVLDQCIECGDEVLVLGRGVHLDEDVCGEGLRDLEEVGFTSGSLDALFLSLGKLEDMAVEGVLYQA